MRIQSGITSPRCIVSMIIFFRILLCPNVLRLGHSSTLFCPVSCRLLERSSYCDGYNLFSVRRYVCLSLLLSGVAYCHLGYDTLLENVCQSLCWPRLYVNTVVSECKWIQWMQQIYMYAFLLLIVWNLHCLSCCGTCSSLWCYRKRKSGTHSTHRIIQLMVPLSF